MNILSWLNTHKKLTLTIAAVVFLFIALVFIIFQTLKDRFSPQDKSGQNPSLTGQTDLSLGSASIKLQIPKQTYALNETVPVKIIANSDGKTTRAFDVVIEYDPEMVALNYKTVPRIPDFLYFVKNTGTLLSISGVQKMRSTQNLVFDNSTLTEVEFTAIKAGKTAFKLIYSPNSTSDSNLLDQTSKDFLSGGRGAEIEVKLSGQKAEVSFSSQGSEK